MSVGLFVFLLSVGANVFFLATRATSDSSVQCSVSSPMDETPLLMGPKTFGRVMRGFPSKTVRMSGTSALLPVVSYIIPEGMMPPLNRELPLFRDQGVPLDESEVQRIFSRLGVTLAWKDLRLLPTLERWRTSDRTMEIALDIEKRALTVTRSGAFSPSTEGRAGDSAVIAIAREFAATLGINLVQSSVPHIVERSTEPGGISKTYVIWPMIFKDVPLLDTDAQPVPAVQVQVGRLSRKALSMTVTLLQPDRMSLSAYPSSSKDLVTASLAAGGFIPIANDLSGNKTDVVYTSITPSYVLLLGDREFPTYIVPTLLAEFRQGAVSGRTFVPALSPDHFLWRPHLKVVPVPAGSGSIIPRASTSSAVQTGSSVK